MKKIMLFFFLFMSSSNLFCLDSKKESSSRVLTPQEQRMLVQQLQMNDDPELHASMSLELLSIYCLLSTIPLIALIACCSGSGRRPVHNDQMLEC